LAGCQGSPTAPPDPKIHAGGQLAPRTIQHKLASLLKESRPTAPTTIAATLALQAPMRNRTLVVIVYRNASDACLIDTYVSVPGSLEYGGYGFTVGPCRPFGCGVCVTRPSNIAVPNAFVALVTDRADTLRVTFTTNPAATNPTVFHHDYALRGPRVGAPGQRMFMLDPPSDTTVVRLDALRDGSVVSSQTLAGLG
jgi:hypothetical protein